MAAPCACALLPLVLLALPAWARTQTLAGASPDFVQDVEANVLPTLKRVSDAMVREGWRPRKNDAGAGSEGAAPTVERARRALAEARTCEWDAEEGTCAFTTSQPWFEGWTPESTIGTAFLNTVLKAGVECSTKTQSGCTGKCSWNKETTKCGVDPQPGLDALGLMTRPSTCAEKKGTTLLMWTIERNPVCLPLTDAATCNSAKECKWDAKDSECSPDVTAKLTEIISNTSETMNSLLRIGQEASSCESLYKALGTTDTAECDTLSTASGSPCEYDKADGKCGLSSKSALTTKASASLMSAVLGDTFMCLSANLTSCSSIDACYVKDGTCTLAPSAMIKLAYSPSVTGGDALMTIMRDQTLCSAYGQEGKYSQCAAINLCSSTGSGCTFNMAGYTTQLLQYEIPGTKLCPSIYEDYTTAAMTCLSSAECTESSCFKMTASPFSCRAKDSLVMDFALSAGPDKTFLKAVMDGCNSETAKASCESAKPATAAPALGAPGPLAGAPGPLAGAAPRPPLRSAVALALAAALALA